MSQPHIIVIGAGVGGLSAAVRLAARGARVTLIEKQSQVGGKLNRWIAPHPDRPNDRPFTFDTGPSLLTLPFVFQDLFAAAGADVRDYLTIKKLDPISRFIWADERSLALRSDEDAMREEIARFAPGDVEGWLRFLERGRHIWALAGEFFLMHAPEQIIGRADARPLERLLDGVKMASIPFRIDMFGKFSRAVDRCVRDPRLREVLYQYATYSGASPFLAPATLTVIPYCELHFGGWYIEGGMYALASALEKLARKLGVDIQFNASVARIEIDTPDTLRRSRGSSRNDTRSARAVRLVSGESIPCDAVVCNADVVWAYGHLLDPADRPAMPDAKLNAIAPGGSGMVLLLGVEGRYPQLAHHTKFMPADYRSDLDAMFNTATLPDDPCIYVCASTRSDPSQAPEGCENLFVLCSAPPLDGKLDWSIKGPRYEARIMETLEHRFGLTDLSKRVVVRKRITPVDLAADYNAHRGSIYGISSNGIRAAFFRPPNRDKSIRNLFFAGGATHPGGGLPLVALSGKIASELCAAELGLDEWPRMNADEHVR